MGITEDIDAFILDYPGTYLWYAAFVFLVGLGLYFTFKLRGMQITQLREQLALAVKTEKSGEGRAISSFEALCIGLGARIGVGNIAGVAAAIVAGGAGAVFWMWLFAIIGAASSFMECTLAQIFKEKHEDGLYHGGPAYYIRNGLNMPRFAIFMAMLTIVTYGVGFVGVQAGNASDAFLGAFDFRYSDWVFAIAMTCIAAIIIFGGIKRIARVSYYTVPAMAFLWIAVAAITVALNFTAIPDAIIAIFRGAFNMDAAIGGGIGTAIMWGLKRGVFSNEAGIGSMPNVAGSADVSHPTKQGLIQSLAVPIDTLIVCSGTAFVILTWGDWQSIADLGLDKAPLVQYILGEGFLGGSAPVVLSAFMMVFAFSSLIGYHSISEANVNFAFRDNKNAVFCMRVLMTAVVFVSCLIPLNLMWNVCDVFMACMAVFNMAAVAMLSKYAFAAYRDYRDQRNNGTAEPVFTEDSLDGLDASGITAWGDD
ncbi:MAG: alanine:cation symporter family protein [Candidatus Methanoplasma sp.]|jgi:AGCS family alanine or glycine:cation symporter/putative sodium/glutamine symporter|nr:alanine:cation symporter family protein [Candidatus Methanoplasma sp.]